MKNEHEEKLEQRVKAELSPIDAEELYEETLRELYGDVKVCGFTMDAANVLRELDPIAFRTGMNDWLDSESDQTFRYIGDDWYLKTEVDQIEEELLAEAEEKAGSEEQTPEEREKRSEGQ